MRSASLPLLLVALAACSGPDGGSGNDGSAGDSGGGDAGAQDALAGDSGSDAQPGDEGGDAGVDADRGETSEDTAAADSSGDTAPHDVSEDATGSDAADSGASDDAGADPMDLAGDSTPDSRPDAADVAETDADADLSGADAPWCDYLDLDIFLVQCDGDWHYVRRWTIFEADPSECPDYFTVGGDEEEYPTLGEALAANACSTTCVNRASTSVSMLHCGHRTGYILFEADAEECPDVYEFPEGLYPSVEAWEQDNPCP